MKKVLFFVLMAIFTVVLVGCDDALTGDFTVDQLTTEIPTTTNFTTSFTIEEPTTEEPTTLEPTTEEPTTEEPTTDDGQPTTEVPTTEEPTTVVPTTEEPTTVVPTTEEPTTEEPTTQEGVLEDPNYDYYVTGNFAGWADAFGQAQYKFQATVPSNPKLSIVSSIVDDATYLYYIDVVFPTTTAGWGVTYNVEGIDTYFDGNLTFKFARIQWFEDEAIPVWWAPSPESGEVLNLTPETFFMPEYIDPSSSNFNPDLNTGNWNDNPVVFVPGEYTIVFAVVNGQRLLGAILIEEYATEEPTTEEPTTEEPTTEEPTTEEPTTEEPTTEEPTTEEPTTEEPTTEAPTQLSTPDNLEIDDSLMILSWSEVEDAISYEVYIDGVMVAIVNQPMFDFSSRTEDQMIFTVKAIGQSHMANSLMSTTIGFVANKNDAIQQMRLTLNSMGLGLYDEESFATELVNKGMRANDLEEMMLSLEVLTTIEDVSDLSGVFGVIDLVFDSMDRLMIEAIISSIVKVELPYILQAELDYLLANDGTCQYYDGYFDECYGYYDYSDEIHMIESLMFFIDNHHEEAIATIMVMFDFIVDVQGMIDQQMITDFETILNSPVLNDFTLSLMIAFKNNFIHQLKLQLPSYEDMVLMNSTVLSLLSIMFEDEFDFSVLSVNRMASAEQMMIELLMNFALEIDQPYLSALIAMTENNDFDHLKAFIGQNILLIDRFIDNNTVLLNNLMNILTDEELESLFFNQLAYPLVFRFYMDYYGYDELSLEDEIMLKAIVDEHIDFDQLLILLNSFDRSFNLILDGLIANDFEIFDTIYHLSMMSEHSVIDGIIVSDDDSGIDYNTEIMIQLKPGIYQYLVTGISHDTSGVVEVYIFINDVLVQAENRYLAENQQFLYDIVITETSVVHVYTLGQVDTLGYILDSEAEVFNVPEQATKLINDLIEIFNPVIQAVDVVEYQSLIGLIGGVVQIGLMMPTLEPAPFSLENGYVSEQMIFNIIYQVVMNTSDEQLALIQNFFNMAQSSTYLEDFSYYYQLAYEDELAVYQQAIILANVWSEFYLDNAVHIHGIIDEVFLVLDDPEVLAFLGITENDLLLMEANIIDIIQDMNQQTDTIKSMVYDDLSDSEEEALGQFIGVLESVGIGLNQSNTNPIQPGKGYEPGVVNETIVIIVPLGTQYLYQQLADQYIQEYNLDPNLPYLFPHQINVTEADDSFATHEMAYHQGGADILAVRHTALGRLHNEFGVLLPITSMNLITHMTSMFDERMFGSVIYDQEFMGVPFEYESMFLYYNTLYLSETDVESWESIMAVATSLSKQSLAITNVDGYNDAFLTLSSFASSGQMPVSLFPYGDNTQTSLVNDGAVSVMKWGQRFYNHPNGAYVASNFSWQQDLANHDVLSFIGGHWQFNEAYQALGSHLGVAVLPQFMIGPMDAYGSIMPGTVMQSGAFTDPYVFVMSAFTTKQAYLEDILLYFTSEDAQLLALEDYGRIPVMDDTSTFFDQLDLTDPHVLMNKTQVDMLDFGIPQPFGYDPYYQMLYYQTGTAEMLNDILTNPITYATDNDVILKMHEVEDIWKEPKNPNYNQSIYYLAGNISGWNNAIYDPQYMFIATDAYDPMLTDVFSQIEFATEIYTVVATFPNTDAGWSMDYVIQGYTINFNGNLALKFVETKLVDGIPTILTWYPSPDSGEVFNLTPNSLYIPTYVTHDPSGGGNWNDNPVVHAPGDYVIVIAKINGSWWFGAIETTPSPL